MTGPLHVSRDAGAAAAGVPGPDDVAAEVLAAFRRYEQALGDADVGALAGFFWDDPRSVRFGVADRQQGAAEITAWRQEQPGVPAGRRLEDTRVLVVDDRCAVVTTLFAYPGSPLEGRQSQTWALTSDGWRIVAAHVSQVPRDATTVTLAVVAAHRAGQPLHPQVAALGARLVGPALTAPVYRMIALPGGDVARGGIVYAGPGGARVEVEVHELPASAVGALVALLPPPLAIGAVELADGTSVTGLVCTHVPDGALDVTGHVSWPAYLASREASGGSGAQELTPSR